MVQFFFLVHAKFSGLEKIWFPDIVNYCFKHVSKGLLVGYPSVPF